MLSVHHWQLLLIIIIFLYESSLCCNNDAIMPTQCVIYKGVYFFYSYSSIDQMGMALGFKPAPFLFHFGT